MLYYACKKFNFQFDTRTDAEHDVESVIRVYVIMFLSIYLEILQNVTVKNFRSLILFFIAESFCNSSSALAGSLLMIASSNAST